MSVVPAIYVALAALIASMAGRVALLKPALSVNKVWALVVLLVPFGPVAFSLKFGDLASPTRFWRMATGPLLLLFFLDGGTVGTITAAIDSGKPKIAGVALDVSRLQAPPSAKAVAAATPAPKAKPAPPSPAPATVAAAKPAATPALAAAAASATGAAPAAIASSAVAAANAAMPAAPRVLTLEERRQANQRELERLTEWYENLKHERGYLRKGDTGAVEAYNASVLKYQAAMQLAKTEQIELAKLTAKQ
jgi:hypothetical protein